MNLGLPSVPSRNEIRAYIIANARMLVGTALLGSWLVNALRDLPPTAEAAIYTATVSTLVIYVYGPWVEDKLAPKSSRYIQPVPPGPATDEDGEKMDTRAWKAPIEIPAEKWPPKVERGQLQPMDSPEDWNGEVYEVLWYNKAENKVITTYADEPSPRELRRSREEERRIYTGLLDKDLEVEALKDAYPDAVIQGVKDVSRKKRKGLIDGAFPGDASDKLADRIEEGLEDMAEATGTEDKRGDGEDTNEEPEVVQEIREEVEKLMTNGEA